MHIAFRDAASENVLQHRNASVTVFLRLLRPLIAVVRPTAVFPRVQKPRCAVPFLLRHGREFFSELRPDESVHGGVEPHAEEMTRTKYTAQKHLVGRATCCGYSVSKRGNISYARPENFIPSARRFILSKVELGCSPCPSRA